VVRSSLPASLEKTLRAETAWVFDTPILDRALPTLRKLDTTYKNAEFVVIFEPPSIHPRIVNQHGLLSAANGVEKNQDDIFAKLPHPKKSVKKIIIKAKAKNHIRVLYPGLPGLCQWLKRYYSPG